MATKDGRAQIWYADSSGNVTGYTESVDEIAGAIIDAYNEHFGTDISIWTPETETLQVGGTVPNWDAYEKIEIVQMNVAINSGSNQYLFGKIEGSECKISVTSSNRCIICNNEGVVLFTAWGPTFDNSIIDLVKNKLSSYSIENVTSNVEAYEVNETVENWNEYTIID